MMEPDLADLMAAWLGRETEPARREELLARLRADEAFRRAFVDEIRMLGMLKTVQSPESRWLRLEDELGWSSDESSRVEPLEDRIIKRLDGPIRWRLCSRDPRPGEVGRRGGGLARGRLGPGVLAQGVEAGPDPGSPRARSRRPPGLIPGSTPRPAWRW